MGGVFAVPNLRGGGEYGEEWHKAGTKLQKQNVFDDFIAAAEWLIDQQVHVDAQAGDRRRLERRAAGRRVPDAAARPVRRARCRRWACWTCCGSTSSRSATPGSTTTARPTTPRSSRRCSSTRRCTPFKSGTCYPPTMITTADHDDRVVPAHSFKFAAALQAAQGCDKPVLIRIETRAGHGAGKPTGQDASKKRPTSGRFW